jgi:putative flippase GtrA
MMYLGARIGLTYLKYTVLGYLVAILFSFFMNLRYTFKVRGQMLKRLVTFFLISLINLSLVELIEFTLIESLSINKLSAILCGMSWYLLTGFILNNTLVYRNNLQANYD